MADDAERLCRNDTSDGKIAQYKDKNSTSILIKKFNKKGCMDFNVFVMTEQNNEAESPLLVFSDYNGIHLVREINTKLKFRVLCKRYNKTAKTSHKGTKKTSNKKTEGVIVGIVLAVTVFIAAVLYVIPFTRVSFFFH